MLTSTPKPSLTLRSDRLCVISSTLLIQSEFGSSCLNLALTLAKTKTSIVLSKLNLMLLPCLHRLPPTQFAATARCARTGHGTRPARPPARHLTLTEHTRYSKSLYKPFSVGGLRKVSLSTDHLKVMKTCVESIKHGTRIGRSSGAGLKYDIPL